MHMESSATFEGKKHIPNQLLHDWWVSENTKNATCSLKKLNLLQPENTPLHTSEFLNRWLHPPWDYRQPAPTPHNWFEANCASSVETPNSKSSHLEPQRLLKTTTTVHTINMSSGNRSDHPNPQQRNQRLARLKGFVAVRWWCSFIDHPTGDGVRLNVFQ